MNAKEYLKQIELLETKIRQKEEHLECLRATAGGSAAIRYDKLNVQITVAPDIMERNVLNLVELEDKIFQDKLRMEHLKDKIIDEIQSLDDERYVNLLYRRYIKHQKFEQIALDMSYDYDYIRVLHGEALGTFETQILHNHT